MTKYSKAIVAAIVSIVGIGVAYGLVTDAQAQQIVVAITDIITLFGVYLVPNNA